MFDNNLLIKISGLSRRTFYRYAQELRNQGIITKKKKYYFDENEALKIAEVMGFKNQFERHINAKTK